MIIKNTTIIISILKFKCWRCYESKINIFITKHTTLNFFYFISNSESTYLITYKKKPINTYTNDTYYRY